MSITATDVLQCRDLTRSYGSTGFELGPVTLTLNRGITCLLGLNGAGKSTLLRMMAGVSTPDSGDMTIGADRIGYVPQDLPLPSHPKASEYMEYAAWVHSVDRELRPGAARAALAAVGLADRSQSRLGGLSGGMKRRVAIAQAIVHKPQLLVVDEPMNGLDPDQRLGLRALFTEDLAPEMALIVSTHLVDDVQKIADRVVILQGGKVAVDRSLDELVAMAAAANLDFERFCVRVMTDGL